MHTAGFPLQCSVVVALFGRKKRGNALSLSRGSFKWLPRPFLLFCCMLRRHWDTVQPCLVWWVTCQAPRGYYQIQSYDYNCLSFHTQILTAQKSTTLILCITTWGSHPNIYSTALKFPPQKIFINNASFYIYWNWDFMTAPFKSDGKLNLFYADFLVIHHEHVTI